MRAVEELPGEGLCARGGWSHPEETVDGSLVWIRLILLCSQAQEVEITGREDSPSATRTEQSEDDPAYTDFRLLVLRPGGGC